MRTKAYIDWKIVDQYMESGCTQQEIAKKLRIDTDTLRNRVESEKGMSYSVYSGSLYSKGVMNIRNMQYKKAVGLSVEGDTKLLIWLGKIRLGQKEESPTQTDAPLQEIIDRDHTIMRLETKIDKMNEKNSAIE